MRERFEGSAYPQGVVLLGVPGTAMTVMAQVAGNILNLPVLTMDVGSVLGSLVGESEGRMAMRSGGTLVSLLSETIFSVMSSSRTSQGPVGLQHLGIVDNWDEHVVDWPWLS